MRVRRHVPPDAVAAGPALHLEIAGAVALAVAVAVAGALTLLRRRDDA